MIAEYRNGKKYGKCSLHCKITPEAINSIIINGAISNDVIVTPDLAFYRKLDGKP